MIRSSSGCPSVSVPVLSSKTVLAPPSRSSAPAPLTMIPARAARESPATNAIGAARMSGQGVATTITASPRVESPDASQAMHRDGEREGQEVRRVAVGEACEVGSIRLGGLDEANDGRVGAVGRRRGDAKVERVAGVGRSGADAPVRRDRDGQRLSGQRGLVENGLAADDDAVRGHDLARAHRDDVAGPELVDADLRRPRRSTYRCAIRGARLTRRRRSRRARPAAHASSAAPPDIIRATIAAARYSPRASAQTIATSAIASTPTSPRSSERAVETHERDEDDRRPGGPGDVGPVVLAGEPERGPRRRSSRAR